MNRLTKETWGGYKPAQEEDDWDGCDYSEYIEGKILPKLGQLEDIEKDLGIDLITLFKVMFFGAYFLCYGSLLFIKPEDLLFTNCGVLFKYDGDYEYFPYYDFGKLWALTKEELV